MLTAHSPRHLKWQMFAVSSTALFLEMMVIRWVPSVIHLIAFYANLMLLSSFLGLGTGAMLARKSHWRLFDWFPVLLALEIGVMLLCRNVVFATSAGEIRLSSLGATSSNTLILIAIFTINALLFVPFGQRMGALFEALPRLSAYAWDLTGSLFGTVCFGVFSLLHFSPLLGMAGVMATCLLIAGRRRWVGNVLIFAGLLAIVYRTSEPAAIWSPYHYITVARVETPKILESEPPPDLRTMMNPPIYSVSVNQFYYHYNAAIDPARYSADASGQRANIEAIAQYYRFPYALARNRDRVLILGSGGGGDVLGALASSAGHVDAVEIDPVVVQVSRRFNAGAPYANPRVKVHVDDARSFLAKAAAGYDVIVYGLLDSHAMFSSMNNVRLDGYVYTVEGLRTAYGLLKEDGMMLLAFYIEKDWLLPKLHQLVATATGREPAMYLLNRTIVFCVAKDGSRPLPAKVDHFQRAVLDEVPAGVAVPTDDWPFLYLRSKAIPSDYLIAIGSLLALSLAVLIGLRGRSFGAGDLHFGLLGMGFLLLETKSITDCSLYFGATWLVTVIVVSGVLLMVMAANFCATRVKAFSLWMYAPLFAALAVLLFVPRAEILAFEFHVRLLWALLVVPLPVFFAGLVFSTTFRETKMPAAAFGANLIGAMLGGFCEYLAMAVGSQRLSLLVAVAYLLSMLILMGRKGRGVGG